MTEQPDNLILRLLQEMRTDTNAQFIELRAQIATIAQGQLGMRTELKELRADLKDLSTKVISMQSHIHEIAIVLDHHSTRLDSIEQHLGLDKSKH